MYSTAMAYKFSILIWAEAMALERKLLGSEVSGLRVTTSSAVIVEKEAI